MWGVQAYNLGYLIITDFCQILNQPVRLDAMAVKISPGIFLLTQAPENI